MARPGHWAVVPAALCGALALGAGLYCVRRIAKLKVELRRVEELRMTERKGRILAEVLQSRQAMLSTQTLLVNEH